MTRRRTRGRSRREAAKGYQPILTRLEAKTLLSGLGTLPGATTDVTPAWFQATGVGSPSRIQTPAGTQFSTEIVSWQGNTERMVRGEWLIELSDASTHGVTTVSDVSGMFRDAPFPVSVVGGLGRVGSLVVYAGAEPAVAEPWFAGLGVVRTVEPNLMRQISLIPNEDVSPGRFRELYGLNNTGQVIGVAGLPDADMDAPEAWDLTTGSEDVVVGVIDTGIDYTHPDLAGNMWKNPGEILNNGLDDDDNGFIDDYYGYDFINGDSNPADDQGHGTHVAGTIGAIGNNGVGVVGVNWKVRLMALKMMDSTGNGPASAQIAAVNYVTMMAQRGVNLVATNNSYGGGGYSSVEFGAIAANGAEGVLFAAAAANSGRDNDLSNPNYPSSYTLDNIIAVAATNNLDQKPSWSNWGLVSVDLAAPGVAILSTTRNNTYGYSSGTSMATPQVAGAVALAAAYKPSATAAEIRTAMFDSVDKISSMTGKVATGGRLNVRGLLEKLMQSPVQIAIGDASVTELDTSTAALNFTVTLSRASNSPVSVDWATTAGTATVAGDFTMASGTLNFAANQLSGTVSVVVAADLIDEPDETLTVTLSNPVGGELTDDVATGTIVDNDPLPTLSFADAVVTEGHAGTKVVNVRASLSAVSGREITVDYGTAETGAAGSATSGVDFVAKSGSITIPAGTAFADVAIEIQGDLKHESAEQFWVTLANAVNAGFAKATAVVTISDDDPIPTVSTGRANIPEGGTGTRNLAFTVRLSNVLDVDTSVDYATAAADPATGALATENVDYVPTSGTLTIPAGSLTGVVHVVVNCDYTIEPNENLLLVLSNPVNGVITTGTTSALGIIANDDKIPTITVPNASFVEGNNGAANTVRFQFMLSNPLDQPVRVSYATADATSGALATAGVDYTATSGLLEIPAGQSLGIVRVPIVADISSEPDEVFRLLLSNPVNGVLGTTAAVGTITNDDLTPTLTLDDVSIVEGNTGSQALRFTIRLSSQAAQPVSLNFATGPASGGALATEGVDYAATNGALVIPAGASTGYVDVTIHGDFATEANESFLLNLTNIQGATVGNSSAKGTIVDDDLTLPTISMEKTNIPEGGTGTRNLVFTVRLSSAVGVDTLVDYATVAADPQVGALATANVDYVPTAGTLTIPAGSLTGVVHVVVNCDYTIEANEYLSLVLSNPVNGVIPTGTTSALGIIANDDKIPTISLANTSFVEGSNGAANTVRFQFMLSNPFDQPVRVSYATADATSGALATAGVDYTATSGVLEIPAGQSLGIVRVPIVGDISIEPNEVFQLLLSNPVNGVLGTTAAVGTITNDDQIPTLTIADVSIVEGNSGSRALRFFIRLSNLIDQPVSLNYATGAASGGALATEGVDYAATSGVLVIAPGASAGYVDVTIYGDFAVESDEAFLLNLTNIQGAVVGNSSAKGTIVNDD